MECICNISVYSLVVIEGLGSYYIIYCTLFLIPPAVIITKSLVLILHSNTAFLSSSYKLNVCTKLLDLADSASEVTV